MGTKIAMAVAIVVASSLSAFAAEDKYSITPAEHLACDNDAVTFCAEAPDEDGLIACMRSKRAMLSHVCLRTFDAGLRRRHLPL
ncbi:MAG TPA: hypothetical protein VH414_07305 [Lichenihabitans sp.]|jgi:hypothetical protein|nr:hypothetical protein [Lichenihabitans sp.]